MNTYRRFFLLMSAGLFGFPLTSCSRKPGKVWRVGYLSARRRPSTLDSDYYENIPQRFAELGYVEGQNLVIEWRFADGDYKKLPELANQLVSLAPDVILTDGTNCIRSMQSATKTIPIVFAGGADIVASGFVKSLARPGGNTTGVSLLLSDTAPKQLEFLLSAVPKLSRIAVLLNPSNPAHSSLLKSVIEAANARKVDALPVEGGTPEEIDRAFSIAASAKAEALIWLVDPVLYQQRRQIAELSVKNRFPSMNGFPEYADAQGLMAYGPNRRDIYRRIVEYADKIFKGANPGDLPVEQPTKLELVINLKTAKALELTIPSQLLILADRLIE